MCTTGGGEGGQKTKRQAARWYDQQAQEAEREQQRSPWRDWTGIILERVVGHAFADVLRRRITLRAWARYELTPTAHDPDCCWRRLCGVLRIGGYQETRNPFEAGTDAHSPQSGDTGWLHRATGWFTHTETADGRLAALDGGPGPQPT